MAVTAAVNMDSTKPVKGSVLVVEDDNDLREALTETLQLAEFDVLAVNSAEAAISAIESRPVEMIVSDVNMGGMSGHDLLRHVQQNKPHIPVLLITAYASVQDSVDAIRHGAVDYLVKPFKPEALINIVERIVGCGQVQDDEPIAEATASRQLLQISRRVAQSDSTVLIHGESGTGKEVLARYIHTHSPRAKQPFIAINCAAIPENMLEAMLFGYEKGAFTGAYSSAPGKFEQANGGTLLLDEISEMPMALQAKLLRVLQEREVERLGSRKIIELDVRVIATTNRDMSQEVIQGRFREDLFYRLNVLPLGWLPLRERRDDILPLAEKLLRVHGAKQHRQGVIFSEAARVALYNHYWPGNVRELDNVVQRALVMQTGREIQVENLMLELNFSTPGVAPTMTQINTPAVASNNVTPGGIPHASLGSAVPHNTMQGLQGAQGVPGGTVVDSGLMSGMQMMRSPSQPVVSHVDSRTMMSSAPAGFSHAHSEVPQEQAPETSTAGLGGDLKQREFEIIVNTMREVKGSRKLTAEKLGISPRTLRYKLAKLREEGLDVDVALGR